MDDPLVVCGRQPARHLRRVVEGLARGDRPPGQPLAQRLTLDQLGNHEERAALGADVVDRDDVGVIQGPGSQRFLAKPIEPFRVARLRVGQHFDRHEAAEAGVAGGVDFAHRAGVEQTYHLVRPEAGGGSQHWETWNQSNP